MAASLLEVQRLDARANSFWFVETSWVSHTDTYMWE